MVEKQFVYINWQNSATNFYLSARLLHANSLHSSAAFCAQQSLDLMLKATLTYWDDAFEPKKGKHTVKSMVKELRAKVADAKSGFIPSYFYHKNLFGSIARYPDNRGSIGTFTSFRPDLDKAFVDLVFLVPFQFNSLLFHTLVPISEQQSNQLAILSQDNLEIERLTRFIVQAFDNRYLLSDRQNKGRGSIS